MKVFHKIYGTGYVSTEEWDDPHPMIRIVLQRPARTPRKASKVLTVGKGAITARRPSAGYTRPHRDKTLVEEYLPFAASKARAYTTNFDDYDEILTCAYVGLCKAAEKYDERQGSFVALADAWIAGEIKMFWRERAKNNEEFGVDEDFWTMVTTIDPEKGQKRMMRDIYEALPKLSSRKQQLIQRRYLDDEPATWAELAHDFNLKKTQLHRLKNEALETLRNELL